MSVASEELTGHVVLVGYGRVGRRIAESLIEQRVRFVVAEQNREVVEELRGRGVHAVSGNAADPAVLIQAHIARARILVIAAPDPFDARRMLEVARMVNPGVETVVRTHTDEETALFEKEGAGKVYMGEHELARSMADYVLERAATAQATPH
jgi:CPA2 family monovalent cation:H+ antiporter-2